MRARFSRRQAVCQRGEKGWQAKIFRIFKLADASPLGLVDYTSTVSTLELRANICACAVNYAS